MNNRPAITSDSLFASNTRLPARTAARVGSSPAAPTMAAITMCVASPVTASASACVPSSTRVFEPQFASAARAWAAAVGSIKTTLSGANVSACSTTVCQLVWAPSMETR